MNQRTRVMSRIKNNKDRKSKGKTQMRNNNPKNKANPKKKRKKRRNNSKSLKKR